MTAAADHVPAKRQQFKYPSESMSFRSAYERLTKSMLTGTPSSSKRSRSWFSTQ
jgi:hypothetical protein